MGPKRGQENQSGADKKRQKMRAARQIPVQGFTPRVGGSAASGNNTLPATIEVEKFAQSRAFEISAMQRAMKSAKESSTQRAFQSLPRHLRRRAASHNIRRLPVGLRAKAASETPKDAAKPKKKSRKLMGLKRIKYLKLNRTTLLLKRQRNKIWLETHIWHAKRMKMIEIWGHRIAEKPTSKAFRASYRASIHGALIHDASYYQYLEISGSVENMKQVLQNVCDPAIPSPGSIRYSTGIRECETALYINYPTELIGPIAVIWDTPSETVVNRKVLIRFHPSIARAGYELFKKEELVKAGMVNLITFEKEFLTFEITGRKAIEVVKAVLKPVLSTSPETKAAWNLLDSRAGPSSVPKGMIIGMDVYDPRLTFPPKLNKSSPPTNSDPLQPSIPIAQVLSFWSSEAREKIKKPTFKKSEIDARRSKLLIPGSFLAATPEDNRIPVLLIQRTISPASTTSTTTLPGSDEMAGFTLVIPAGWGMAFWQSLVYSETRIGGLRERSQSIFESGSIGFPQDAIGTKAFIEWEMRRRVDDEGFWNRKPPAKRFNFSHQGISVEPFEVGFFSILKRILGKEDSVEMKPWIVSKEITERLDLPNGFIGSNQPKEQVSRVIRKIEREMKLPVEIPLYPIFGEKISESALVRVRLDPIDKGAPEELGYIYRLEDSEWESVRSRVEKGNRTSHEVEEHYVPLPPSAVIGRLTSANFSLKRGRGFAIGAIPLLVYLKLTERDRTVSNLESNCLVLFRNREGIVFRAASLTLL